MLGRKLTGFCYVHSQPWLDITGSKSFQEMKIDY